ncbi:MAG: hypothetical protein GY941_20880 [Planctomycetes bacterium]|nr:hypothetical protein [Planctomycetota bacterium]
MINIITSKMPHKCIRSQKIMVPIAFYLQTITLPCTSRDLNSFVIPLSSMNTMMRGILIQAISIGITTSETLVEKITKARLKVVFLSIKNVSE